MKKIIMSLIGWLSVIYCYGQDTIKKNSLSLNFGPGYIMRQDVIFSPLIHSDLSFFNIGLEYTRHAKLFQKISFRYGNFNPMVSTPYDFTFHGENEMAHPHIFNLIDLDYLIGKDIFETEKTRLTVGGIFSTDIQAMNYVYGRVSNFGYYSSFGLGVFGKYGVKINEKNSLSASLQLPLVALLARSPYLVNDDEFIENISSHSGFKTFMAFVGDGEFVTWNRLQTFDLGLTYTYKLSDKWELGAGYLFEFVHANQPLSLLSFRNSINIMGTFKF